jgi:ferredoxin
MLDKCAKVCYNRRRETYRSSAEFTIIPYLASFVNRKIIQNCCIHDPEICVLCLLTGFVNSIFAQNFCIHGCESCAYYLLTEFVKKKIVQNFIQKIL